MADDMTAQVRVTGDSAGAEAALNRTRESVEQLRDSFGNVGEALDNIKSQFATAFQLTGVAAAYEGLTKLGEVLKGFGDSAIQIRNMAEVLGVTVEEFQGLQLAAQEAGVSVEMMGRSLER